MTKKPIYVKGEDTFMEAAHDLSVSGQPVDEAAGRCFKLMMPSLVQWLNAEEAQKCFTEAHTDNYSIRRNARMQLWMPCCRLRRVQE